MTPSENSETSTPDQAAESPRRRWSCFCVALACILMLVLVRAVIYPIFFQHGYGEARAEEDRIDELFLRNEKRWRYITVNLLFDHRYESVVLSHPKDDQEITRLYDALRKVRASRIPAIRVVRPRCWSIVFTDGPTPQSHGWQLSPNPG